MSSLAVVGKNGAAVKLASRISLPEGFVLPEGSLLSWEDQPQYKEGLNPPERRVIRYKRNTKAYLGKFSSTISMRVESSSPKELFELVEILYLYIGGKVDLLGPYDPHRNSVVEGIKNDLASLRVWAKRKWQDLLLRLRMMSIR